MLTRRKRFIFEQNIFAHLKHGYAFYVDLNEIASIVLICRFVYLITVNKIYKYAIKYER